MSIGIGPGDIALDCTKSHHSFRERDDFKSMDGKGKIHGVYHFNVCIDTASIKIPSSQETPRSVIERTFQHN